MSPKGHFSCRQLRAETSWGPCISMKVQVSSLRYCFQRVLLSGQTSCKPTCLSRELSMQHTEVLRTYRVKKTQLCEKKRQTQHPSWWSGWLLPVVKFDSVLSIHVVMVIHPFNMSRCFVCPLHKLSQVCHYPSRLMRYHTLKHFLLI